MWSRSVGSALDVEVGLFDLIFVLVVIVRFMVVAFMVGFRCRCLLFAILLFNFLRITQTSVVILGASRAEGSFAGASRLSFSAGQTPDSRRSQQQVDKASVVYSRGEIARR